MEWKSISKSKEQQKKGLLRSEEKPAMMMMMMIIIIIIIIIPTRTLRLLKECTGNLTTGALFIHTEHRTHKSSGYSTAE
jgi:hypothetical protein